MYTEQNDSLQKAYLNSIEDPSNLDFASIATRHGKRHTAAIHIGNFMKFNLIEENINMLIACYIKEEDLDKKHNTESLELAKLAMYLRKDQIELSVVKLKGLTDEVLIFALVQLWMEVLFLDSESMDPKVHYFIDHRLRSTSNILVFLHLYKLEEDINPLIDELITQITIDMNQIMYRF